MTTITMRKVSELVPFDRNSRTHSEAQVAQLAASIEEFGFTNPVLIDEHSTIIAGEGRSRAAKKLKLDEVPCIVVTGLTAAQKAAYVIADNKLALNAGWDAEMLHAELSKLADLNYDISLAGFSEVEVLELSDEVIELVNATGSDGAADGKGEMSGAADRKPDEQDWSGMPEFKQPDAKPFRTVLVHMNTQAEVDAFAELIGQNITDKTKFVWYPKQVKTPAPTEVYA